MSYLTVKEGIAGILKNLTFQESNENFLFNNASVNEYTNTFILKCVSGEMGEGETLASKFYDSQIWEVLIAFQKSSQSKLIDMDEIHRAKDSIISELDDPANWSSFVRMIKYKNWEIEDFPNYTLLTIRVTVVDTYTY